MKLDERARRAADDVRRNVTRWAEMPRTDATEEPKLDSRPRTAEIIRLEERRARRHRRVATGTAAAILAALGFGMFSVLGNRSSTPAGLPREGRIAFVRTVDGQSDIYAVAPDGS